MDWRLWAMAALVEAALVLLLTRAVVRLRRRAKALDSQGRSDRTRFGQTAEQFVPLAAWWPWDAKEFRFLGSPIDGVQFADDEVILIEIKTGASQLSPKQRRIRDLVQAGRVRWEEVRVK